MSTVLVVGNVTKDVYLRLDNRRNRFEVDGAGVAWMDLAFDGSSHHFYTRHPVFGGAAVSLEVLARFGVEAGLAGSRLRFADGGLSNVDTSDLIYRYILTRDDEVCYFSPSQRVPAGWVVPEARVDWVFVDRSAGLSHGMVDEVLAYLEGSRGTKLAVFVSKWSETVHSRRLEERADLVFADVDREAGEKYVCITDDEVVWGDKRVAWSLDNKQGVMTHLTSHSVIAASVLGAMVLGKSVEEALLLAWANVENANLDGVLNLTRLEEIVVGENHRVGYIS